MYLQKAALGGWMDVIPAWECQEVIRLTLPLFPSVASLFPLGSDQESNSLAGSGYCTGHCGCDLEVGVGKWIRDMWTKNVTTVNVTLVN